MQHDKPSQADITLVTYTFNDGHFVNDLVNSLSLWTIQPCEIIILDDGSTPPYVPAIKDHRIRLLSHETNLGIPATKHEAISAAKTDYILAMDCDTRLSPNWLETCIPVAKRHEIGMVSGPVINLSGTDLVSRYQRYFGDNHNLGITGPTNFIPGNAFLIRRDTWESCQGFSNFDREVCEDHFLCSKILNRGLLLWCEEKARAKQIRVISRLAMLQRYWKWCHTPLKEQAKKTNDLPTFLFMALGAAHANRIEMAIQKEELLFIYLEAIYLSYSVLDILDHLILNGQDVSILKAAWWHSLAAIFQPYPRVWAIMRSDLERLGQQQIVENIESSDMFEPIFAALTSLSDTNVYEWLNREGMMSILREDENVDYNFSSYDKTR